MENSNKLERLDTAVVILIGVITFLFVVLLSIILNFDLISNLIAGWIATTLYSIFAFLYMASNLVIERKIIEHVPYKVPFEKEVIKEIIKEVPIQIPIENKTLEVIEKPVIRTITQPVYIKGKKLEIPKYDYMGSTETKTYHKRNCKFAKMIKNKYKLHSNSQAFFKKKRFHACKTCIKN